MDPTLQATLDAQRAQHAGWRTLVYAVVGSIPRGRVLAYRDVAVILGAPRRPRHVGFALAALEPGQDVPWWRVVRADGSIAFQGDPHRGSTQLQRLQAEGVTFRRDRVLLAVHRWEPWL